MNTAPRPFHDVRMRGFRDRTDVLEVVRLLRDRLKPLPCEPVELGAAACRVLGAEIVADVAVPNFNRSAMDGFAVRAEETFGAGAYNPLAFTIVGQSFPGRPFLGEIGPGQAVRIMTGAPLPLHADAVVPVEHTHCLNDIVQVLDSVTPGKHVGRVGEDIAVGAGVLPKDRVLRPQDLGVLASIGIATVSVYRRPRVLILVTGDELLPSGTRPQGCQIVDSNSIMLTALTERDGGISVRHPIIPDRRDLLRSALLESDADVILLSGGTSVGQDDHAPGVLAEIGELLVHGVALRPASPTGVAFLGGRPVFLLPGNPVSCLCAYDLFAGLAVRRLGGRSARWPYASLRLPLGRKLVSAIGRVDYVRVAIKDYLVEPLATSGAAILSSTSRADGFVMVPRDSEGFAEGVSVQVFLYECQPNFVGAGDWW